jgi:hypothetical protein
VSYLTRITGAKHEDVCIFMIISRLVLLRMRNVSNKRRREYQNADVLLNIFFFYQKIVPVNINVENNNAQPDRSQMGFTGHCILVGFQYRTCFMSPL